MSIWKEPVEFGAWLLMSLTQLWILLSIKFPFKKESKNVANMYIGVGGKLP